MNPTRISAVLLERRQNVRLAVEGRAIIRFAECELPCVVVDLGLGGAGLMFEGADRLPQQFQLQIEGERQIRDCQIVWSDQNRLGVRFT